MRKMTHRGIALMFETSGSEGGGEWNQVLLLRRKLWMGHVRSESNLAYRPIHATGQQEAVRAQVALPIPAERRERKRRRQWSNENLQDLV
jgi:hypothetical protein